MSAKRESDAHSARKPTVSDAWQLSESNLLWAIAILLILGVTLTAIALLLLTGRPSSLTRVVAGLVGALAGAIFGSSLTILIDKRLQRGPVSQMLLVLERTLGSTMTSPESDLVGLRRIWHHYHLTLLEGQPTWRYDIFYFDSDISIGSLTTRVAIKDPDGESHEYRIDAAVRGSRLILTQTALQGQEAPVVEIFPHILHDFRRLHAGIGILQTWDGDEILTSTILSHKPLWDESKPGFVDLNHGEHLAARWKETFGGLGRLLQTAENEDGKRRHWAFKRL